MHTDLHLVSMPWASPGYPSIQLGALRAAVQSEFRGRVRCRTHSAFFEIPYLMDGSGAFDNYRRLERLDEFPYFLLLLRRFGPEIPSQRDSTFNDLLLQIRKSRPWFTETTVDHLENVTIAFLRDQVLSRIDPSRKTVVGFTLNFNQTYASLFAQKVLELNHPSPKNLTFLFGGYLTVQPELARAARHFSCDGWKVLGEGESKLFGFLRKVEETDDLVSQNFGDICGVRPLQETVDLKKEIRKFAASQIQELSDLPVPDYSELYSRIQEIEQKDPFFSRVMAKNIGRVAVLEGSRGCFAKCDFCGLNAQYSGFRASRGRQVFHKVRHFIQEHGFRQIRFSDNVCDSWAEEFADQMIEAKLRIPMFMALRAHHTDAFWEKLAEAGVHEVQIGVEALSDPLLRAMGKGTRLIQNVSTLKSLRTHGIRLSGSNLITHHPKSTVQDVRKTEGLLTQISHLAPVFLSEFELVPGSRLFDILDDSERESLTPKLRFDLPRPYNQMMLKLGYVLPERFRLPQEVHAAWDRFADWFNQDFFPRRDSNPQLLLVETGEEATIIDTRGREARRLKVSRAQLRVLRQIDKPIRLNTLAPNVQDEVLKLAELGLAVLVDEFVLGLTILQDKAALRNHFTDGKTQIKLKSIPMNLG